MSREADRRVDKPASSPPKPAADKSPSKRRPAVRKPDGQVVVDKPGQGHFPWKE